MAVKNTAQVVIDGKIITLGGYESEEYFQKVAAYMNNKIGELSQMPGYSRTGHGNQAYTSQFEYYR